MILQISRFVNFRYFRVNVRSILGSKIESTIYAFSLIVLSLT